MWVIPRHRPISRAKWACLPRAVKLEEACTTTPGRLAGQATYCEPPYIPLTLEGAKR